MGSDTFWQRWRQRLFSSGTPHPAEERQGCFWQVDIHSHLLPGVDDGVADWEQTLACLRQFAEWGIQKVVTTPHVSRDWYPNKVADLKRGQRTLQALAEEHHLPLTIEVAAEYMLDDFFPELLQSGEVLTFGGPHYLLVETGWAAAPFALESTLFRIQTHGYTPLLAHPERYSYYHDDEAGLARLREMGCLFQLNWMSLTGRYGRRVRKQAGLLLQRGWVDFIGSDLHRPTDLPTLEALFAADEYRLLRDQPLRNQSLLEGN
jgi:tyrosine-protein phosphatase YwqE